MKSIIQETKECFLCGRKTCLEKHHIMAGLANRRWSEAYGLTVFLCADCHRGTEGAQYNKEQNLYLKRVAQQAFEEIYGHDKWMETFRKNYL